MNYKERLVTEWITHGKIVLAVDFDDTIFPWKGRTFSECEETLKLVKWVQIIGAYIMIHTSSDTARHTEIRTYCATRGLKIDGINENVIPLPYGNNSKPYYNWQLCDRSGLEDASRILEEAAKEVLTLKKSQEVIPEGGV